MEPTREHAAKIVDLLKHGLTSGLGQPRPGQMCVEAAVCFAMGEPHGDNPSCVAQSVRRIKIRLNDSGRWKSKKSRADGMRRLAVAQLGTAGTLDEVEFAKRVAKFAIQVTVPFALRVAAEVQKDPKHRDALEAAALKCEREGTADSAREARKTAYAAADADAYAAAYAAAAADAAADADAAAAAAAAADAYADAKRKHDPEKPLRDFAEGVVQILIDMKAPGTQWLDLCEVAA